MKRVARFGRDFLPKRERPKSAISKKPRPFRKMKMPHVKLEMINLQRDLEDDGA